MDTIKSFLKATLVGGLMFLVPVVLIAVVLRHALQFADRIAQPLAAVLPISHVGGIAVATLIATGSTEQLVGHLRLARANGLTEDELKEVIIHLAFYAGWPRAMSAITVAKRVFAEDAA